MEIEYQVDDEDFINFNVIHYKISRNLQKTSLRRRIIFSSIYLVLAICMVLITDFALLGILTGLLFLIIAALYFLFIPKLEGRNIKRVSKKMLEDGENKNILGKKILRFENDKIYEISESAKSEFNIEGINNVVETKAYILIYLSSVTALIIPKNDKVELILLKELELRDIKIEKYEI